ncbi:hypothetical protein CRE_23405 [Caenorhabditis remanei]|uniref:Uncharacterized protein n=2 Tax=Caenorhabditis remanei TaxID=31234 RepID=E3MGM1_CAERE|nr:hypothetical protein CRE_23405 [Caenorhabditis remanei]
MPENPLACKHSCRIMILCEYKTGKTAKQTHQTINECLQAAKANMLGEQEDVVLSLATVQFWFNRFMAGDTSLAD